MWGLSVIISAALLLFAAGCTPGLEPAWKAQSQTILSFQLGGLPPPVFMPNTLPEPDDSRALVGGGGFLYLRLGGVEPGVRNWYGPWFVKEGGSFETAEIPAGDYRFMALLYSAERIEHRRFIASGTELSVAEALSLPDDDFMDALGIQRNEPGEPEDPVVQANGNAFSWPYAVQQAASL